MPCNRAPFLRMAKREEEDAREMIEYAKLILRSKVFLETFHACGITNTGVARIPSREAVMNIMRNNIELGTDAMYRRRAMTVRGWIDWMFRLCKDVGDVERL